VHQSARAGQPERFRGGAISQPFTNTAATAPGRSPTATPRRSIPRPGRWSTTSSIWTIRKTCRANGRRTSPARSARGTPNWPGIREELADW